MIPGITSQDSDKIIGGNGMDDGNLRESLGVTPYAEEVEDTQPIRIQPARGARILGMTAPQRFAVAVLILLLACILGSFLLILSNKIVPF
jgi:hypothetical protein